MTALRPAPRAPISPPSVAPAPSVEPARDAQLLLINMDRSSSGLRQLIWSPCLAEVARTNAIRIARQGYLSHTDGPDRDLDCRLGPNAGENVAFLSGVPNNGLANSMFMNSPEHRANILGPYQYIGIAWVAGADSNSYIAVEFG